MKQLRNTFLIVAIGFLASCTSSKKFDFASAYKFRTIKHSSKTEQAQAPASNTLEVSTEDNTSKELNIEKELSSAENKLLERTGLKAEEETITTEELKSRIESLDKKEKRQLRKELIKELKTEMKQLKSMEESNYSTLAEANSLDMTGYTRTGVIVGGLGVIVLILGALFGVGALTAAGAILIIGGVIFILIDVV